MKPLNILLVPAIAVLMTVTVQAQERSPNPQGQRGDADSRGLLDILNLLQAQQQGTLRGGGGRGPVDPGVESQLRELERFINRAGAPVVVNVVSGAWWSNTALVTRLGLTVDQKAKIEKSFENHRLSLESSKAVLEKEESQLARLLEAESVDRNAALAQIYRVVNARGEMERVNATMTLEMREHLTREQWVQLQAQSNATMKIYTNGSPLPGGAGARGSRGQDKF